MAGSMFSLGPAIYKPNNSPIMKLEIVARGRPDTDTVEEAFALLDEGRKSVVRIFNDITTPEMHKLSEKVTHVTVVRHVRYRRRVQASPGLTPQGATRYGNTACI